MKSATVAEIKKELKFRSPDELMGLCLRLARFKKENKELLTYLLFEAEHEPSYILSVKELMDEKFSEINTDSFYYIKKSVRKILRETKKFIRYSNAKETEVELLLHFCEGLLSFRPSVRNNRTLMNLLERQRLLIQKKIGGLHEDLQHDYTVELNNLMDG
ncbi:MAG: hypothetical protein HKN48_02695 [Flavobacteriaceae bacterium]|nr:hypothetical protein [Flavobacteriaceae bacterium]